MSTMHTFYQQFAAPGSNDSYLLGLLTLAQAGLTRIRSFRLDRTWDPWG